MVDKIQILKEIRSFLEGKTQFSSFRLWMVRSHLEIQGLKAEHKLIDVESALLLANLEVLHSDFSDEVISEAEWKSRLAKLLLSNESNVLASNTFVFPQHENINNPVVIEKALPAWAESFGTSPLEGFVLTNPGRA